MISATSHASAILRHSRPAGDGARPRRTRPRAERGAHGPAPCVVTSVARDEWRRRRQRWADKSARCVPQPDTAIEVLVPVSRDGPRISTRAGAKPFSIQRFETVTPAKTVACRPATRSRSVLRHAKSRGSRSALVGLGERPGSENVSDWLPIASNLTVGQYLQPSAAASAVDRWCAGGIQHWKSWSAVGSASWSGPSFKLPRRRAVNRIQPARTSHRATHSPAPERRSRAPRYEAGSIPRAAQSTAP